MQDTRSDKITLWRRIGLKFRKKRFVDFEKFYQATVMNAGGGISILDLGGELLFWNLIKFKYESSATITLLNLEKQNVSTEYDRFIAVAGDATNLSEFSDKSFDLVFSNSVIEHVGDFKAQGKMASEMHRVGKHYYLQTPNKYFFLEPHYRIPLIQFFPLRARAFLLKNVKLRGMSKAKSDEEALAIARSIRLMTEKELKQLFPDATIKKEKFLFMTKSFCVFSK